jgi:hypothetical protein
LPYIKATMKFSAVSVVSQEEAVERIEKEGADAASGWDANKVEAALPAAPEVIFWNVAV